MSRADDVYILVDADDLAAAIEEGGEMEEMKELLHSVAATLRYHGRQEPRPSPRILVAVGYTQFLDYPHASAVEAAY